MNVYYERIINDILARKYILYLYVLFTHITHTHTLNICVPDNTKQTHTVTFY